MKIKSIESIFIFAFSGPCSDVYADMANDAVNMGIHTTQSSVQLNKNKREKFFWKKNNQQPNHELRWNQLLEKKNSTF